MDPTPEFVLVGSLAELAAAGMKVVAGADRPLVVYHHEGQVHALDNRCPHMGFPLHQGSVNDGIVTCPWHHARFDLASGCTFDLFADDVPTCRVEVRDGQVWVAARPELGDLRAYGLRRLRTGLQQNVALVIAKSVLQLLSTGAPVAELVREGILHGCAYRDGWSPGMVILTAMGNLAPRLDDEGRFLALYHGLRQVAADCAGQSPRRLMHPLGDSQVEPATLQRWLRYWTTVRHRDAAERTLLTAIARGATPAELAALLVTAATDRPFANTGHVVDFLNKACEALDLIGWEHAAQVLPTVVGQLVAARGGEESNAWRHPIDLLPQLDAVAAALPEWVAAGADRTWDGSEELAEALLADDPAVVFESLAGALRAGARPTQLAAALTLAAAHRLARFGAANELGDWISALHTYSYCHALQQLLQRLGDQVAPLALRGLFHGAVAVYLDRFLNVPPAALPGERGQPRLTDLADRCLTNELLTQLDTPRRTAEAAQRVDAWLAAGRPVAELVPTLAHCVLREDADFHTFQMLEAALTQEATCSAEAPRRIHLLALARYLAAHAPTQRQRLQTAEIALRLHRGERLHEAPSDVAAE